MSEPIKVPIIGRRFPCCGQQTKSLKEGDNRRSCPCGASYTVTVIPSLSQEGVFRAVWTARTRRRRKT